MRLVDDGFGNLIGWEYKPSTRPVDVYTRDDGKLAHFTIELPSGFSTDSAITAVRREMGHRRRRDGIFDAPPVLVKIK